jgi:hypothetical protein
LVDVCSQIAVEEGSPGGEVAFNLFVPGEPRVAEHFSDGWSFELIFCEALIDEVDAVGRHTVENSLFVSGLLVQDRVVEFERGFAIVMEGRLRSEKLIR